MHSLILHDLHPLHWAWAGLGIALITLLLKGLWNHSLGISTGFEQICSLWSRAPYFSRSGLGERARWRWPFMGGLLAGGVLSAVLAGGWTPIWDLGMFDAGISTAPAAKLAWMFAGGLLIGFGTRLAGGCTSGHGIFGLANFDRASLVSVLAFMASGIVTANLLWRVILGGEVLR